MHPTLAGPLHLAVPAIDRTRGRLQFAGGQVNLWMSCRDRLGSPDILELLSLHSIVTIGHLAVSNFVVVVAD